MVDARYWIGLTWSLVAGGRNVFADSRVRVAGPGLVYLFTVNLMVAERCPQG